MNVLVVCGSARSNGITERMCHAARSTIESMGHESVILDVSEGIGHCIDCGGCRDGPCVKDDAMKGVYEEFSKADLLILATPIHFSGPSSVIKTVIDRFQPWWFSQDLPHPRMVIGLMCGGSERPSFGPTASVFRAFSAMLGMEWMGHLEISNTDVTLGEGVEDSVDKFIRDVMRV